MSDRQGLTLETINPRVKAAQYAVRGEIATRAERYHNQLDTANGKSDAAELPFENVIFANIGNPQQLDQKPITFFRQVTSLLENPALLEHEDILIGSMGYQPDSVERARKLLKAVKSVGAYSQSQGVPYIRRSVADFIGRRDGHPADPDRIFLTSGASSGVSAMLNVLVASPKSGIMIPIPQYPLYTATISLLNAKGVPYYLEEENGWATSITSVEAAYKLAREDGTDTRALVIINPGNPTGATLSRELIERLVVFAARERVVLIADEVYQANVFAGEFVSFKKVLCDMKAGSISQAVAAELASSPVDFENAQLVSLHSVSKGMTGECGHRSGYFELTGFSQEVVDQIYKCISIQLCPSVVGQCVMEMMVNPPREGEPSHALYKQELDSIYNGLKDRAYALWDAFKQMEGVDCQEPAGAMYLFPTITLPQKAVEKASELKLKADGYYCSRLLDQTGISVVPGSGFGQVEGTFHLRTTFLAPGTEWTDRWVRFHSDFMREFS